MELTALKSELNITDEDFTQYFSDEKTYFENLEQTPITETLKTKYVQVLNELPRFQ